MSDYKLTRDAASKVTTQYKGMLENLEDDLSNARLKDPLSYLTLDTDELGIWLINETPEGPQQLGHISWKNITRGVQQALLQEKFLIDLAKADQEYGLL